MQSTSHLSCNLLADLLTAHGVRRAVLSPGSRNTPLILALSRREEMECHVVIDERSASFIALGMSIQTGEPVALVCTSGTALLNYAPAVAEAFYRHIPLVVISADRPEEWIDQDDSQTIWQQDALAPYVKRSCDISARIDFPNGPWWTDRMINDVLLECVNGRPGPVHINVRLDAPLHTLSEYDRGSARVVTMISPAAQLPVSEIRALAMSLASPRKVLIIAGFHQPDEKLNRALTRLASLPNVAVMTESISNMHSPKFIDRIDSTLCRLSDGERESLRPDTVITLGGAIVSRHIKDWLRNIPEFDHWHVGISHTTIDCFKHLNRRIDMDATIFMGQMAAALKPHRAASVSAIRPKTAPSEISPQKALSASAQEVAFPWVYTSYPDVIHNLMTYDGVLWQWHPDTTQLSWQLKLYQLTKRICEVLGYKVDFSEWSASPFRSLIVCNTLPAAWNIPQYARALPTWTVAEYFEKLELFLSCEFDFDHRAKTVKFSFSKTVIDNLPEIEIQTVVDAYDVEISKDDDASCNYIGVRSLVYKDTGHHLSNYYSCDWLLEKWLLSGLIRYDTMDELLAKNPAPTVYWDDKTLHYDNLYGIPSLGASGRPGANGSNTGYPAHCILYARDVDTYFVYRSLGLIEPPPCPNNQTVRGRKYDDFALQPINVFGSCSYYNNEDVEEIEFVPVCIDHTDDEHGYVMFLSPSEYNESGIYEDSDSDEISQLRPAYLIEAGEKERASAYYDDILVAFGTGGTVRPRPNLPCPTIDFVVMTKKDYCNTGDELSLRRYGDTSLMAMDLPKIDPRQKFKISFISDSIPNPRSIFNIRGKRYVCEKITATFSEDGMSQLLKGEFYPLLDD